MNEEHDETPWGNVKAPSRVKKATRAKKATKTRVKKSLAAKTPTAAVTIDAKRIPIPAGAGTGSVYPFGQLKTKGSFFVRAGNLASIKVRAGIVGKQLKRKFLVSMMDGGVRVWRLA